MAYVPNFRKTKHILSLEQQLLQIAQEELEETLKTIEADRQKINVLQHEQTFTVRQIKDAMSQGTCMLNLLMLRTAFAILRPEKHDC